MAALERSGSLVIEAPPGAGKTTRVPPALLESGVAGDGRILVLEPRRVAARAAARRMAEERGEAVGNTVGYHVRFDRVAGPNTRILVITEGLLLRMLQDDPFLEGVTAVVVDEFHERSLHADLALALCRRVQEEVRPDLRLVVMSATLDAEPVARFLGDCPRVRSEGRTFPVDVVHLPGREGLSLEGHVVRAVREVIRSEEGDVLVFLPGVGEIRRTMDALGPLAQETGLDVLPLYGDLSPEDQDRAIRPGRRRRVVVSTNVAETSVTIDGVRTVVDSGLQRRSEFDQSVGFDRLVLRRISRASATQRAGRAGRTAPGRCVRLWSEGETASMEAYEPPEIGRMDLAGPVLQLLCWGERDVHAFPFFESPGAAAIDDALERLRLLGALNEGGVSALGQAMARLPTGPRLARLLVEGKALGIPGMAATAAAIVEERDVFARGENEPNRPSGSDVLDRLEALESGSERHAGRSLLRGARGRIRRVARQLERALDRVPLPPALAAGTDDAPRDRLRRALLAAWPDRVTLAREEESRRGVMVGRRGVRLSARSALAPDERLWLSIELGAGQRGRHSDTLVHVASAVEREWLPAEAMRTGTEVEFDPEREQVMAFERTCWHDLVLEERVVPLEDPLRTAEVLAEAVRARPAEALALERPEVAALRARIAWVGRLMPELNMPAMDEDAVAEQAEKLCWGRRSLAELRRIPAGELEGAWLDHRQREALQREAPTHLAVPSGRRVPLQWREDGPPVLAARIQEFFGWRDTPRVIGGRVGVLLHLLAPNGRPQQVTEDLESFWTNTYPEVRRELRARYAKHFWPEDPWNAPPTSRTRKRMGGG
ncbi:MAG: ATP-dependent helicase HrpB [Deltaproteobacteria bacterium]|nr:MAG: ATP-dependent helicase HrpB [Deltaproteobacteria bacterium]